MPHRGNMAWESMEDHERESIAGSRYAAREKHYRAVSRTPLFYIFVMAIFLVLALFGIWVAVF